MKQKIVLIAAILILALTACSSTTGNSAYPNPGYPNPSGNSSAYPNPPQRGDVIPNPADANLLRNNVSLSSTNLLTTESSPSQFALVLKGSLPTPCDKLRIAVSPPDLQNKIVVDVYSVADPNIKCTQALQPFEENFPLGSFPAGHYTVWVNGEQITKFDS